MSGKEVEKVLAQKVLRLERVARARRPEEKFFDTSLLAVNFTDTSGAAQSIVNVAAGTDYNNRVGDTIRIHRIEGFVRIATGNTSVGISPTNDEHIRCNVVQDLQQVPDTVAGPSTVFVLASEPESNLLNEASSHKRFKILATSPLWSAAMLNAIGFNGVTDDKLTPTQMNTWNFDFKCNIRVSFNGTAGTDFEKNGVFVTWRTNISADTVDSDGRVRIYYTDC